MKMKLDDASTDTPDVKAMKFENVEERFKESHGVLLEAKGLRSHGRLVKMRFISLLKLEGKFRTCRFT